jgi:transcriptional regulator with XRE-family HTH domain
MENPIGIRQQLRQAIQASGQSLKQLGRTARIDGSRLSRFLRGERDLSLEAVERLCEVLRLEFCHTGDDPNVQPPPQEPSRPRGRPRKMEDTESKKGKRKKK